jgi:transcriptional regulator with XRE-family HTH domain
MPKPSHRLSSVYTQSATKLLGLLIREQRIKKKMTTTDLSIRSGISRSLLQRIENGDTSCSIGAFFEAATIVGVSLFNLDEKSISQAIHHQQERLTLLPSKIRPSKVDFNDDF